MATTTKKTTTKAKTKTTKSTKVKSAAKKTSANKSSAAKTAAPKAAVKATVTNKASTVKKPNVTLQKLRSLHMAAAGLFILLAVSAAYFMDKVSYQLTLGHLAKDELASKTNTVLAPAIQSVYDVELRWLVVGILLLSAVLPILYLTRLQNRYAAYLNQSRMLPLRWIDYAVTGGLIIQVVALMSGVSDIPTLKVLGGLVAVTAILGLISERQNNESAKPVKSAYYTGLFTGLLPWALIAAYAVATFVHGAVRSPWYVYALYATVLGGFLLMARNQRMEFRRADYLVVERNYVVINMLTKVAFAAILISGLYR